MRWFVLVLVSVLQPALAQQPPGAAVDFKSVSADAGGLLRVHFIDVGGGMAALIETPSGRHVLIDGGKQGTSPYEEYVDHFIGDGMVDILIVTHADDDHFFNLMGILDTFEIGE